MAAALPGLTQALGRMKLDRIKAALIAIFSAGWVFPLWLSVNTYFDFWRLVALPIALKIRPIDSCPFLDFADNCFGIAMLWLGCVIAYWSYMGYMAAKRRAP